MTRNDQILEELRRGEKQSDVARKYKVTPAAVSLLCLRHGLRKPRGRESFELSPEVAKAMGL